MGGRITMLPDASLAPSRIVAYESTDGLVEVRTFLTVEDILKRFINRIATLERAVAELQRVPGNSYSSIVTETYEPFPGVVIQYDPNVPVGEVRVKLKDGE